MDTLISASKVIKLGNTLLRLVSEPISESEYGTEKLRLLSDELFRMMKLENGLGLAAPQVGINKRIVVFGMEQHPVHTALKSIPFTVLCNPSFEAVTDEIYEDYEGCLSVGALRGKVSRYKTIYYKGFDVEGRLIEREASDLHARVVQHETDHLDGVIFLDKVTNYNSLGFHDELVSNGAFSSMHVD